MLLYLNYEHLNITEVTILYLFEEKKNACAFDTPTQFNLYCYGAIWIHLRDDILHFKADLNK